MPNIWGQVGGVQFALPMETLLGAAHQLLGMNAAADALQYKNAFFDQANSRFYVPTGSAATPSYTFQGQVGTGLYYDNSSGNASVGFTVNGVRKFRVELNNAFSEINLRMMSKIVMEDKGANIASGVTIDLGTATGNYLYVTHGAGNTSVTSLGGATLPAGTGIEVKFQITGGTLTLVHDTNNINIPGGANLLLQDGDVLRVRKTNDASAFWEVVGLQRGLSSSEFSAKGQFLVGEDNGGAIIVGVLDAGVEGQVPVVNPSENKGISYGTRLIDIRQTVLSAAIDGNGYASAISAGAGLTVNLAATAEPLVVSFANGYNGGGCVDFISRVAADANAVGGVLEASNTSFLHATYASVSTVTWGKTLVPPQYDYIFRRNKNTLLNFEGANGSTSFLDDFGNSWVAGAGAPTITTAQSKFGASSLDLTGGTKSIRNTSITSLGDGSWEISLWFRINALPGAGTNAILCRFGNATGWGVNLYLNNNAGTTRLAVDLSSNGTSNDIVNLQTGTNTVWTLNQWNKGRLVFDALGGTYRTYLSLNGAAETQETSTASTARICAVGLNGIGDNAAGASIFNGWIDAFRFISCATKTAVETPVAAAPTITDHPVYFFSIPKMKMFEVTGASVVANTDPVMTQRNCVFVGEIDTGGAGVTTVRNYAIRGQYLSTLIAIPANATITSFNHNIGTTNFEIEPEVINLTASLGYQPGEIAIPQSMHQNGTTEYSMRPCVISNRNVLQYIVGFNVQPLVPNKTGGSIGQGATVGGGNWNLRVRAKRTF